VLSEFERISDKGGVLGAMESMYQRGKIQEESLYYETLKDSGELPIIGVNTYLPEKQEEWKPIELSRASAEEKNDQIHRLKSFQTKNKDQSAAMLVRLKQVALQNGNIFEELLQTVRHCSLGQITQVLYEVGGRYRRNM
jgi:isobutyryl-CoA mutase